MSTLVTWYITTARKHHGKQMFVRKDLNGYTSDFSKIATFKTKREAEEETNLNDHTHGKEIVTKLIG